MGVKAIKGRSKSTGQLTYFLSHGDTVILGSGNSKKKLSAKLDEVDSSIEAINTALGKRATVQAIDSYLNTNNHMPMADVYTRSGVMMDYIVENGAILIKIPNVQTGLYEFVKFTKVSGENAFIYTATYNWAQLSDIQKKLLDLGLVTALEIVTMIPVEATAQNQLADKLFVTTEVANKTVDASHIDDNAVTTAKINAKAVTKAKLADDVLNFIEEYLADFKGTVTTVAALKALTGDKNDWAALQKTDAQGNVSYERYRYDANYDGQTSDPTHGDTGHWKFELNINSSSFTAAQWAAINSGITSNNWQGKLSEAQMNAVNSGVTSGKVGGYDSHIGNDVIHVTYDDKTAWNNKKESFAIPTPDPYVSNPYLPEGWRNKIPMLGGMIVQERIVFVDGDYYVVFVGGSEPHYMIFTYELNSDAFDMFVTGGLVFGVNGSEQYANVLFAAYPEFASCADLGGYEFDEVDVDTLLS